MMVHFPKKFTVFTIFAKSSAVDLSQGSKYDIVYLQRDKFAFFVLKKMWMLELYSY